MNQVLIVMARCQSTKHPFGIRFEEESRRNWSGTWAFPLKENSGQSEGYDNNKIEGNITLPHKWPGCPYCKNHSIFCCQCGKVNCDDGSKLATCAWCGMEVSFSGKPMTSLDGGGDR